MEIALLFPKTKVETTNHPTQSKGEGVGGEGQVTLTLVRHQSYLSDFVQLQIPRPGHMESESPGGGA